MRGSANSRPKNRYIKLYQNNQFQTNYLTKEELIMIEIYIALAIIATGMFIFALLVKPTKPHHEK